MNKTRKTLLAAAFVLALPSAHAADASVNGKPIKQSLIDYVLKDATARGQKIDDNVRTMVLNQMIVSELVVQEAQKQGLDKQPDYVAKEELMRRKLLVDTFIENYIRKNPVSEADTKAAYEEYKKQVGDKEYRARHILVKTEAEAKEVVAQLSKGADFAKLAKEKSLDPGSKEKGGDLDWFSPAGMVKPFSDAVTKLQKGLYTTVPVQTQFGWHVIRLEDSRTAQPPAYDKVKDGLEKQIQQRNLDKYLADLRAKAKITN
ncbi:MAG: peptidylprolyl isomerase [Methylobacterium sp.]|nr:peptidylprolyl isomerase [Methylobacterium sp.]